jgi:hypothetical protein
MELKSAGKFNPLPYVVSRKNRGIPYMEREEMTESLLQTRRNILRKLTIRMRRERSLRSW